jgi:hypothetical protein
VRTYGRHDRGRKVRPFALALVHPPVRFGQEVFERLPAVPVHERDPVAERQPERPARALVGADGRRQPIQQGVPRLEREVRQQGRELVTTKPSDDVSAPEDAAKRAPYVLDDAIALLVSQLVVDALQPVDVGIEERHRRPRSTRLVEPRVRRRQEATSIEEPRELVGLRLVPEGR